MEVVTKMTYIHWYNFFIPPLLSTSLNAVAVCINPRLSGLHLDGNLILVERDIVLDLLRPLVLRVGIIPASR